jgi:DNA-binding HxlR family transcriptional regulator
MPSSKSNVQEQAQRLQLRTYGDACAAAHALDLVGERWALLIVRELLFGPKRFTDLQAGLAPASANVLSQRLRELEATEIVQRRQLGAPARVWVYELTERGRDLEELLVNLARWGARSPLRERGGPLSVDSLLLALKTHYDPSKAVDLVATFGLKIGEDPFTVRADAGGLQIANGEPAAPDATLDVDADTFRSLVIHGERPKQLDITGSTELVHRLLEALR